MVNIETLIFMDANEATLLLYGYTRKEFPTMNLKDIRPESELENIQKALDEGNVDPEAITQQQVVHQKKDGELMDVLVRRAPFRFKGVKNNIVIATDMTGKLIYVKARPAKWKTTKNILDAVACHPSTASQDIGINPNIY